MDKGLDLREASKAGSAVQLRVAKSTMVGLKRGRGQERESTILKALEEN
jgi:hypothetical protein